VRLSRLAGHLAVRAPPRRHSTRACRPRQL